MSVGIKDDDINPDGFFFSLLDLGSSVTICCHLLVEYKNVFKLKLDLRGKITTENSGIYKKFY